LPYCVIVINFYTISKQSGILIAQNSYKFFPRDVITIEEKMGKNFEKMVNSFKVLQFLDDYIHKPKKFVG